MLLLGTQWTYHVSLCVRHFRQLCSGQLVTNLASLTPTPDWEKAIWSESCISWVKFPAFTTPLLLPGPVYGCGPHGSCLAIVSYTGDLFPACLLCPLNLSLPASDYVFVKFKLPKERFFWVELAALLLLHRGHKLAGLCEMGHSWAGPLLVRPVGVIPRSVSQRQGIAMAVT